MFTGMMDTMYILHITFDMPLKIQIENATHQDIWTNAMESYWVTFLEQWALYIITLINRLNAFGNYDSAMHGGLQTS